MTPERYDEVRRAFIAVRCSPPSEQARTLRDVCGDDSELLNEIETLLSADRRIGGFLESPALGSDFAVDRVAHESQSSAAGANTPAVAPLRIPKTIGRYRVVRLIGEGGMGTVYEAFEESPVRRTVAIKVLKHGMYSREAVARFAIERQALALLTHSGVARLYDAGETPEGRPYFVMEYVAGVSITAYCDRAGLTVIDRLHLFERVCVIVQHAHQKGLIHRDLKPANILVGAEAPRETEADSRAGGSTVSTSSGRTADATHGSRLTPQIILKVIDFGLARSLDGPLTADSMHTAFGRVLGTPEYMSPEQSEGGSVDVDIRSDVYSLGAVLYELLAGCPPFDPQRLRTVGFAELQRILRDERPLPPSRLIQKTTGYVSSELDLIVGRAMEKDRDSRYPTVAALEDDVRRFIAHEPIQARPPSRVYQLKKFARRNRAAVVGMAGVMAALVVGLSTTTAMYLRATSAERKQTILATMAEERRETAARSAESALAAAQSAERQAEEKRRVLDFMRSIFDAGNPDVPTGSADRTIREAADAAAQELDSGRWSSSPGLEFECRQSLGRMLRGVGAFEGAEVQYRKALTLIERGAAGDEDALVRRVAAQSRLADLLIDLQRPDEADDLVEATLATVAGNEKLRGLELPSVLVRKSRVHGIRGEFENAVRAAEAALSACDAMGEDLRMSMQADVHSRLGDAYLRMGRLKDAEHHVRAALQAKRFTYPPDHPLIAVELGNLAVVLDEVGRSREAEPLFREAMDGHIATMGESHPRTIGITKNYAVCLIRLGRNLEAAPILEGVVSRRRKALGPDNRLVASDLYSLGTTYHGLGEKTRAEDAYREAIEVGRKAGGFDDPSVGDYVHNLAVLIHSQGRHDEAQPLAREALRIREQLGHSHYKPAQTKNILGSILIELVHYDEAEQLLLEAYEVLKDCKVVPPNFRIDCIKRLIKLYETRALPRKAAEWRTKLT